MNCLRVLLLNVVIVTSCAQATSTASQVTQEEQKRLNAQLIVAVEGEEISLGEVQLLVERGANVSAVDNFGWSVLYSSVGVRDNLAMMQFLVERGANIYGIVDLKDWLRKTGGPFVTQFNNFRVLPRRLFKIAVTTKVL